MSDGTYYGPGYRSAGINNVASYQVSGKPYLTGALAMSGGTEMKITFPSVTSRITIKAGTHSGTVAGAPPRAPLRVTFASTGTAGVLAGQHYITLSGGNNMAVAGEYPTIDMRIKCKEIFISVPAQASPMHLQSGSFQLYAETTGIGAQEMFDLTGPGIDES
jgi:hypothetical protein